MNYKCNRCGRLFNDYQMEHQIEIIIHTEVDTRQGETIETPICPYCCSTDFNEHFYDDEEEDDV